jgi:hypothetical protein
MNKSLPINQTLILLVLFFFAVNSVSAQITATRDNTLYENINGDISNGSGEHFFVGRTGVELSGRIMRGLVAFEIVEQIPQGVIITDVRMTLHMSRTSSGPQVVDLHRVTTNWGEGTSDAPNNEGSGAQATNFDATWVHTFYPNSLWTNTGGDFVGSSSAAQMVDTVGFYTWGSTTEMIADVQNWIDNPSENFGWLLMGNESSEQTSKRFDSKENITLANRPVIIITYEFPNEPPIAVDDDESTDEDVTLIIDILGNDSDSDGTLDPSTIMITNDPSLGNIIDIDNETGEITYEPDTEDSGEDSFTYTVEDDDGATSNEATVTISIQAVNDAPLAVDDDESVDEDATLFIDILNNDSDVDSNIEPSSVSITNEPSNGTIIDIATDTGEITYEPDANYNGIDFFTYTVEDEEGDVSNEATVTIDVQAVNDPPQISDLPPLVFDEDDTLHIPTANWQDYIEDNDDHDTTLLIQFIPGENVSAQLAVNQVIVSAPPNWFGVDVLQLIVSDGQLSDTASVAAMMYQCW